MASTRDRVFAWVGVIVAAVSAVALSAAVIVGQIISSHNQPPAPAASAPTCSDYNAEPTLPIPAVYKPNTTVTALQVADLTPGSGPAAKAGDCLVVKYYGTLANGKKFDENFTQPTGLAFPLGKGQVIPGWDQGLVGMQAGAMRRLVIPPALAYGSQGNAAIPPNSTLVFVVKLLRIQKS